MSHHADPAAFTCRCAHSETSENIFQEILPAIVPVSPPSPFRFNPWDIPSNSGSISSTGSSPEIPTHTITGYDHPHRSDDQPQWGFSIAGDRYEERSRPLEYPLDFALAPSPFIRDSRIRLDRLFPRIRAFDVVYTEDTRTKLREGMRRRCFNCKAIETTTWRRSSLSLGKLLCNKCGLFERTHHVSRPETFPRRRRARPSSIPDFSSGEQWQFQNDPSSIIPLFQPFDVVGGQPISPSTSWMTQNEAGSSSPPATGSPRYPTSQQQSMYRGDSQI